MIPLADDLPRTRAPLVTLAAALAAGLAAIVALVSGDGLGTTLLLLACSLWIWVFGRSVEDRIGPFWLGSLILLGGTGAVLLGVAAGMDSRYAAAAAAPGVAFEVVAAHLLRFRGAHVLCLSIVPYYAGFVMTPAWLWGMIGAALAVALAVTGAFGS